jgi:tyrosyl-tRNA synthetase
MQSFRSDLLRALDERGYIHQCTDASALDELAFGSPGAYIRGEVTLPVRRTRRTPPGPGV